MLGAYVAIVDVEIMCILYRKGQLMRVLGAGNRVLYAVKKQGH